MAKEEKKGSLKAKLIGAVIILGVLSMGGLYVARTLFTQEGQNKLSRSIENFTGINGIVEVYSAGTVVHRWFQVDKLTTGEGTDSSHPRPYRYGYGYRDANLNGKLDPTEKTSRKKKIEFSDYSTSYIFYEE